jgi:Domain of unknown function (DUF4359)
MNRLMLGLVLLGGLLVATNPTRSDFNTWAQSYVAKKIEEQAAKRGEDPNDGRSQIGGTIAGLIVANLPIERQNYLALSLYRIKLPSENGEEKVCSFLGIAGQFLPVGGCDFNE